MATGVIFRPYSRIPRSGFRSDSDMFPEGSSFSGLSFAGNSSSGKFFLRQSRVCNVSVRPRCLPSSSGFSDDGHLQYYVSPSCGGKKKEKSAEAVVRKEKKEKKKLIKGLLRDLLEFSGMGYGVEDDDSLIGEARGKIISEAASILLAQLEQLTAEEKERKRKQKERKAALKTAAWMSFSSESSDECQEILTANCLGSGALAEPQISESQAIQVEAPEIDDPNPSNQEHQKTEEVVNKCNFSTTNSPNGHNSLPGKTVERIEVCMGGKCKKSGAVELLEELERMVSVEGAVVGCKCMGKCRNGPNVRVLNKEEEGSIGTRTKSLCTGVSLEDVGTIVVNFLGNAEEMSLVAA